MPLADEDPIPVHYLRRVKRAMWLFGGGMLVPGLILTALAVRAFFTQHSQVKGTAAVLAKGCGQAYDAGSRTTGTGCDLHSMSAGQFILVLCLGCLFAGSGAWLIARAEALAVRVIRRRGKSARPSPNASRV